MWDTPPSPGSRLVTPSWSPAVWTCECVCGAEMIKMWLQWHQWELRAESRNDVTQHTRRVRNGQSEAMQSVGKRKIRKNKTNWQRLSDAIALYIYIYISTTTYKPSQKAWPVLEKTFFGLVKQRFDSTRMIGREKNKEGKDLRQLQWRPGKTRKLSLWSSPYVLPFVIIVRRVVYRNSVPSVRE